MRVFFESSFLRDLRRIDNVIEMNKYSYSLSEETILESAIVIFEKDTMTLKVNLEDDAEKLGVSTINLYYKLKGVEGDSRLAFTIYLDHTKLDSKRNIFEIPLGFERSVYKEPTDFTPETTIVIPGKEFDIKSKDKVVIYCSSITNPERYIKVTTENEVLFEGMTPSKIVLDYTEKINQRGIVIKGNEFMLDSVKLNLEHPVKATITCPILSEDNKFLLRPLDYGTSLYKNFEILGTKLVWKESYQKYSNTEGLKSESDAKVLESKEGKFTVPSRFIRSYSNLKLYIQGMNLDGTNEIVEYQKDELTEIPDDVYHCWDSPMIDGEQTEETPNCIYKCNEFLNPDEVFYGNPNTHYLQYLNISDPEIYALLVYGLPESVVEFRFNKDSEKGTYIEKQVTLDEKGVGKLELKGIKNFVHLNNIRTVTTNKISGIYFVTLVDAEEVIFVPTGDGSVYLKEVDIDTEFIDLHGSCDYIEYEVKENEITEHSRGSISIESVPEINIEVTEFGELGYNIDRLLKKINLNTPITSGTIPYAVFRLSIDNNYVIENGEIKTEKLVSEISLKIRQLVEINVYWKLYTTPDYYEQEKGLFIFENQNTTRRTIYLETNDPNLLIYRDLLRIDTVTTNQETLDTFGVEISTENIIYTDYKYLVPIRIIPLEINTTSSWIP